MEEAQGYQALIEIHGLTQEEAASRVGKSRPAVADALRLLGLCPEVLEMVRSGTLSAGHARALLPLEQEKLQKEAAAQIIRQQLSVRQTEALVKRMLKPPSVPAPRDPLAVDYVRECETALTRRLGRKTTIYTGKKKGKIELEYYGDDDLQRLIEALETLGTAENQER